MAGKNSQITVAVISLLGVLGTAIIANWDTIFPPEESEPITQHDPGPVDQPVTEPVTDTGSQPETQAQSIDKK